MFFDPTYMIMVALPGLILSLLASFYTKSTFAKYSKVGSRSGLTGAQAADQMLQRNGVRGVSIERVAGNLTDHYDPSTTTLRLSDSVYDSPSLAAIGVACHEAGHALQHAHNYAFLGLRTALVPAASLGSNFSYLCIGIGFFFRPLLLVGILLFSMAVLFSIVTLPVEWNASARAKRAMVTAGIVSDHESYQAGQVLNAAFLTYVAAASTAILTLLYYLMRAGLLGGRDD